MYKFPHPHLLLSDLDLLSSKRAILSFNISKDYTGFLVTKNQRCCFILDGKIVEHEDYETHHTGYSWFTISNTTYFYYIKDWYKSV